jgi:hypothetical protein
MEGETVMEWDGGGDSDGAEWRGRERRTEKEREIWMTMVR